MVLQEEGVVGMLQAALLIDADNFSDPVALNAAWMQLQARAGRVTVCRAYGGAQRLHALAPVWSSLGARTFPNLAVEKNTTDAALIADAVALHFQQGVRVFAIASGDADFAPLVVRLREWGCEVWCFAMESTLFAGAQAYYDRVVRFASLPAANPELAAPVSVWGPAPVSVTPKPTPVVPQPAKPAPLPPPKVATTSTALPEDVARILKLVPDLREASQPLNQVVPVLRQKNILGKTTKSTKFFARYSAHFKLTPPDQPTQLTYVPARVVAPVPVRAVGAKAPKCVAPAVLSWPVAMPRHPAPPLLPELHGLRSVLIQLAQRRVTVADVLLAVPELLSGQPCALSAVAGRLRQHKLLRASDSALRIFERYPDSFAVKMGSTPQTVTYRG